jgi:hypothetical protein
MEIHRACDQNQKEFHLEAPLVGDEGGEQSAEVGVTVWGVWGLFT